MVISRTRKPIVVAALQSPHLLNIWSKSSKWRFSYLPMGDHEGLEEAKDIDVQKFDIYRASNVRAVLVCSPMHLDNAEKLFPNAQKFWVVHTGYDVSVLPPEHLDRIDGIVTLSAKVLKIQLADKPKLLSKDNHVIAPFYEADPIWRWKPDLLWTIRSRPNSRHSATKDRFDYVTKGIMEGLTQGQNFRHYGQDAPDGYIDHKGKIAISEGCSAYISALPEDAGFGLAEHEALSLGVPIVGSRWGDMDTEMPDSYASLVSDESSMVRIALELMSDKSAAQEISATGIEYINQCRSKDSMDRQVRSFTTNL